MKNIIKGIINQDVLNEIVLALIFFISSIIFAFNEDKMEKEYQKKYIVVIYLLFFMYFVLFGTKPYMISNSIGLFLLTILLLNVICGINYGYKSDALTKFIGRKNLVILKSLEWFFLTKTYIAYVFVFALGIISYMLINRNINVNTNYYLYYIMFSIFFIYHLLTNMIDTFGIYPFENLSKSFFETKEYFKKYEAYNEQIDNLPNILGFLIFVEDKDYFFRKGTVFSIYFVIKRKLRRFKSFNIESKSQFKGKFPYWLTYYYSLFKATIKLFERVFRNIKTYVRGFSTIEQQIVRVSIMYPDTFDKYMYRRKIFVEWVVNPMFFKAFRERRKLIRRLKRVDYNEYKVEFLLFYYKNILGMPTTVDKLIDKICRNSRLSRYNLEILLKKYDSSELKHIYREIIEEQFKKLNMKCILFQKETGSAYKQAAYTE